MFMGYHDVGFGNSRLYIVVVSSDNFVVVSYAAIEYKFGRNKSKNKQFGPNL